jgi:chromosome segregation ATPase
LLKEIENLGKSWADLEAQNTKKILNLASIEDLKSKHKEDKLKLEHKFSLLTRQSASVDNARIALKKQCEKQSEMIIKQQEREKAVSEKLLALEKENASRTKLLEDERLKVSDLMSQISTFEAQNTEVNKRCENVPYITFKY